MYLLVVSTCVETIEPFVVTVFITLFNQVRDVLSRIDRHRQCLVLVDLLLVFLMGPHDDGSSSVAATTEEATLGVEVGSCDRRTI